MRSRFAGVALGCLAAGCLSGGKDADPDPPPRSKRLRQIPGLAAIAVSEVASATADDQLGPPPPGCLAGDSGAHVISAELAPAPGVETIIASAAHGVVVLDAEGARLAALPFPCGGSADEVIALAAGDAGIGVPVVAVVVTSGGRREAATRVELLAFDGAALALVFSGLIEERDGEQVGTGQLRVTADGLTHRRPDGTTVRWRADPWARRFTPEPR